MGSAMVPPLDREGTLYARPDCPTAQSLSQTTTKVVAKIATFAELTFSSRLRDCGCAQLTSEARDAPRGGGSCFGILQWATGRFSDSEPTNPAWFAGKTSWILVGVTLPTVVDKFQSMC